MKTVNIFCEDCNQNQNHNLETGSEWFRITCQSCQTPHRLRYDEFVALRKENPILKQGPNNNWHILHMNGEWEDLNV